MYKKMYAKCIPHFDKLLYIFCIQNVNKSLSKCGIHFVYILYTSVVYILCNFCLQNVYTISVWGGTVAMEK